MPRTKDQKEEYKRLKEEQEKIEKRLNELENLPVIYGYCRVSSIGQAKDGNSLEAQRETLAAAGAEQIFEDVYTGTKADRPELDRLLGKLKKGDTLIVCKLDRIARNLRGGLQIIDSLSEKGVTLRILNMGTIDDSSTGRLIRNIMLSFAEWERDMIMQRTQEGKELARRREGYHEGRPKKFTEEQRKLALKLLEEHSYKEVSRMTGISVPTLSRIRKEEDLIYGNLR